MPNRAADNAGTSRSALTWVQASALTGRCGFTDTQNRPMLLKTSQCWCVYLRLVSGTYDVYVVED